MNTTTKTAVWFALVLAFMPGLRADDFIISYWCGPPTGGDHERQYAEIAECNFTHPCFGCWGNSREQNLSILDVCAKHGLKFILLDDRHPAVPPSDPAFANALDAIIADYSSHPGFGGYFLDDEPQTPEFARLADLNKYLLSKDPTHLPFINLLPNYATPGQLIAANYDEYLETFCTTVQPRLLCYDHYALFEGVERAEYFPNMESIRRAGLKHKIPMGFIFQCTPHGTYRDPSETDLRWQVNTALAYGAKALFYFTYFTPTDPAANFHNGIIDPAGKRTPHYDMAKRINAELKVLGPTLMQLTSTAVYHTGELPSGCTALPADAPVQVASSSSLVIGLHAHDDGSQWAIIVNRDLRQPTKAELKFATSINSLEQLSPQSGDLAALPLQGGNASLDLPSGGIVLLKLKP